MIITNKSNITYNAVMPDGSTARADTSSNTVSTEILTYSVSKTIRSDKTAVKDGETIRNTVTIANNSATKISDGFFSVPQPDGAGFVAGSVKINGIAQPNYDPRAGFAIPDLKTGETLTIEYDLKADSPTVKNSVTHFAKLDYAVSDPTRGKVTYSENTDAVSVKIISDKISVIKSVDKSFALKGEILHYTITVANTGNAAKSDMIFKDRIPDGTTFVADSVKINGTAYSVYNPETGFVLQSLAPGKTVGIEFDVKVN